MVIFGLVFPDADLNWSIPVKVFSDRPLSRRTIREVLETFVNRVSAPPESQRAFTPEVAEKILAAFDANRVKVKSVNFQGDAKSLVEYLRKDPFPGILITTDVSPLIAPIDFE